MIIGNQDLKTIQKLESQNQKVKQLINHKDNKKNREIPEEKTTINEKEIIAIIKTIPIMRSKIGIIFLVAILLASCDSNSEFDNYIALPKSSWNKKMQYSLHFQLMTLLVRKIFL
nr:hypothetical protein BACY1_12790 [Tenacibaculum mesophilum]